MEKNKQKSSFKTLLNKASKRARIEMGEPNFKESCIHKAINQKKFGKLKKFAKLYPSEIDHPNSYGQPPLIRAIENKLCADRYIQHLILFGANVNFKTRDGRDPLLSALAFSRNIKVIDALLKKEANASRIYNGRSSLCIAMECCSIGVIKLIAAKCPPSACTEHLTGIHCALTYSKINLHASCSEIITFLFTLGINLNLSTSEKPSALCYALQLGVELRLIRQLTFKGAWLDCCSIHASTFFCALASKKEIKADLIRLLIHEGSNTAIKTSDNYIPLRHVLTFKKYETDVIKLFLENQDEVDEHMAEVYHIEICPKDEDIVNNNKLLHCSMYNKHCKISAIQMLIDHGGQLDKLDQNKETPLHIAVRYRPLNIISFLVEKGAPLNAKNWEGKSPLHLALEEMEDYDLVKLLIAAGAEVTTELLPVALKSYSLNGTEISLNCLQMIIKILFLDFPTLHIEDFVLQQWADEALISFIRICQNQIQNMEQNNGSKFRKYIRGDLPAEDIRPDELALLLRMKPSVFYDLILPRVNREAMISSVNYGSFSVGNIFLNNECVHRIVQCLPRSEDLFYFLVTFSNPCEA